MSPSGGSIPAGAPVDGLDEVERALSLMQGRDPKYERARRETREAADRRAQEVELEAIRDRRKNIVRTGAGVAIIIVTVGAGAYTFIRQRSVKRLERALDPIAAPFLSQGFVAVPGSFGTFPTSVELESESPECFIVAATAGSHVEHGGVVAEGEGTFGFCTCGPEVVVAKAAPKPGGAAQGTPGVRLLRGDGRRIGGIRALPFMAPMPASVGAGGTECAEDQFDGWLESGRSTASTKEPTWLAARAPSLPRSAAGLHVIALAEPKLPAAVAIGPASSCFLAIAERPDAKLGLRWKGGERVIEGVGSWLGWCSQEARSATVLREGGGEVVVLAGPADSLGGVLGIAEVGARTLKVESRAWAPHADLEWSAQRSLTASGILPGAVSTVAMDSFSKAKPSTRVVALSVDGALGGAAFDDDRFFCMPPLDPKAHGAVCTEPTHDFFVRIAKVNKGGLAEGTLPLWLETVASAPKTPGSAVAEGKMLALVRRLTSEGFVPTFLEAATEHEFGLEVFGRKGEDAVVAVGLSNRPPFAFPYTNDASWTLDEAPRVIPLEEGHVVSLVAKPPPTANVSERRTVIFRRKM